MKKVKIGKAFKGFRPEADIFKERKPVAADFQKVFSEYLCTAGAKASKKDFMEISLQLSFCEAILTKAVDAEKHLAQCEDYIMKYGRKEEKALVHHIHCRLFLEHSDFEKALAEGVKALYLFQQLEFPFFKMNTTTCCGVICSKLNLYTEAIDYLSQSHSFALQMGDKKAAILATANLNSIRQNVLPVDECIRLNEEFLQEIKEEFGSAASMSEASTCIHLAYLYMKAGKFNLADSFGQRTLSVLSHFPQLPPYHFLYTNVFAFKSELAASRGDEEGMCKYALECSTRAKLIGKPLLEIDVLFIQLRYYLAQNNIATAKKYLDQAAHLIPPDHRGTHYLDLNENSCLYYHAIGDAVQEMVHFKLVHEYKIKAQQEALASRTKYMTTIYELEMVQKEAEIQKQELDHKTQELNLTSHYLQQRNELLTDLQKSITTLQKQKSPSDTIIKTVAEKIKQATRSEEIEKVRFKEKFDDAQRNFISELHDHYPSLSTTECRICALLRSGFNTKEIAHLLSSSSRTIENHRATIRRKMNLDRTENLNLVLTEMR